ncbi:3D domain-containing protein [Xinfangfangia pollutisoli]|uniref:3D domain-containing protein n=1 Tax=Xinfangfangia pollutisoli TaxID=2865960 RepID=UPI001CD4BB8B|nr:3D domain-containing protein [Xinfangfangia pollutisoli]
MKRVLLAVLLTAACQDQSGRISNEAPQEKSRIADVTASENAAARDGISVQVWSTVYFAKSLRPASGEGMPLLDMQDRALTAPVQISALCEAAIEGTAILEGQVYNYAGMRGVKQDYCGTRTVMRNATLVRWKKATHPLGDGNRNNALIPFRTIACDQRSNWIPDPAGARPARFGERILIPSARGTLLPNGEIHDGIFICGDVGGAIQGNHIDLYIGAAADDRDAIAKSPFNFSKTSTPFQAYVMP